VSKAVSEQTKKSPRTIERYLAKLVEEGAVEKTDAGYRLAPKNAVTKVTP